jgi:hypothetical protein
MLVYCYFLFPLSLISVLYISVYIFKGDRKKNNNMTLPWHLILPVPLFTLYKISLSQILLFRLTQILGHFEVWTSGTAISSQQGLFVCIQVKLLMCFLYKCTVTKVFPRTVNYWKLLYSYTPEQNYREQYKTTHTLHKQKQNNN